jgi:hypothetical protein
VQRVTARLIGNVELLHRLAKATAEQGLRVSEVANDLLKKEIATIESVSFSNSFGWRDALLIVQPQTLITWHRGLSFVLALEA